MSRDASLRKLCPPNPGQKWEYKNGKNNVTSNVPNCLIEDGKILVAISEMFGGPRISDEANDVYHSKTGKRFQNNRIPDDKISRTDPSLISLIRELGPKVDGNVYGFTCSRWRVVGVDPKHYESLEISNNDGFETLISTQKN